MTLLYVRSSSISSMMFLLLLVVVFISDVIRGIGIIAASSLSLVSFPIVTHVQTFVETANDILEDFPPCIIIIIIIIVIVVIVVPR